MPGTQWVLTKNLPAGYINERRQIQGSDTPGFFSRNLDPLLESGLRCEIKRTSVQGGVEGCRGLSPQNHFLQLPHPNSAKRYGMRPQIQRTSSLKSSTPPPVASHPLNAPGKMVLETKKPRAGGLGRQLAGAAQARATAGSAPQV